MYNDTSADTFNRVIAMLDKHRGAEVMGFLLDAMFSCYESSDNDKVVLDIVRACSTVIESCVNDGLITIKKPESKWVSNPVHSCLLFSEGIKGYRSSKKVSTGDMATLYKTFSEVVVETLIGLPDLRCNIKPPSPPVQPAAPLIKAEAPAPQPPAAPIKIEIISMPTRETTSTVERDQNGNLASSTQIEKDA